MRREAISVLKQRYDIQTQEKLVPGMCLQMSTNYNSQHPCGSAISGRTHIPHPFLKIFSMETHGFYNTEIHLSGCLHSSTQGLF